MNGFAIIGLLVVFFGFIGYVANIVKITGASFSPLEAEAVVRAFGMILPPVGAVLGYIPAW